MGLCQAKRFVYCERNITEVEEYFIEWEKAFVYHTSDKELTSKIYK